MVEFGGWEMPISYKGIIQEHLAVRQNVGIFDVSHMGRVLIRGNDAEKMLDYLSTNAIAGKNDFSATYTVLTTKTGKCVDDVMIYREGPQDFFLIVNAANRQKDLEHLTGFARSYDVTVQDCYEDGILAVQGPKAESLLANFFVETPGIKSMHFASVLYEGEKMILSRTGYTGAGGFEIYGPSASIVKLWDVLLEQGKPYGIEPIGLGARDTLRLEMGYALYGHEISEEIAPSESVSAWTVKWKKTDFLGKNILEALEQSPEKRSEYGIILREKGIAREGYEVFKGDQKIGVVTSGTLSPTLNQAIAIILVKDKLQLGDRVEVQIRNRKVQAEVVPLPFYKSVPI